MIIGNFGRAALRRRPIFSEANIKAATQRRPNIRLGFLGKSKTTTKTVCGFLLCHTALSVMISGVN
jgi:hypothetical protein